MGREIRFGDFGGEVVGTFTSPSSNLVSWSIRRMFPVSQNNGQDYGSIESPKVSDESKVFASSGDRLAKQGSYNIVVIMYDEASKASPNN